MLSDLCHQTGVLGQPEEYFRPDYRRHWSREWSLGRGRSYSEYIAAAVGYTSTPNGVFGVKMHSYQMDWFLRQVAALWGSEDNVGDMELLERWLPNPGYIRLKRLDIVRQAISYYRAVHSNVWFQIREDDPAASEHTPAESIDRPAEPDWGEVRYLENGLRGQERRWTDFFEENEIDCLELVYEDMVDAPAAAVEKIIEYMDLDVPSGLTIEPRLKKQADEATERWYDEYLLHRDAVTPVAPRPRRSRLPGQDPQPGPWANGTDAPEVFADPGQRPTDLGPEDYIEKRVSWPELVASLVVSGLDMGPATMLVDALPGEGAPPAHDVMGSEWRRSRTPLQARPR